MRFCGKYLARAGENVFAEIDDASDAINLARDAAHPPWLVARWAEQYGFQVTRQICAHDQTVPDTAIHIHGDRSKRIKLKPNLPRRVCKLAPGRLLSAARRVISGDVTASRAYQEGRVSIQDEASQLVAILAGRGETILDCCAAPGRKTSLLARRNPRAKVFATELHPHRARLLRDLHASAERSCRRCRCAAVAVLISF